MITNAQWSSVNGSFALTDGFPAVEISGSTIYIATCNYGVYKSNDNGVHWTAYNNGLNYSIAGGLNIKAMKVNGTNLYLATSRGLYIADINTGIWYLKNVVPISITSFPNITSIEFNGNQIFVGSENGLYTSNDNGATWIQLANYIVYSILFENNNLYVGYIGGISKSTDLGITWTNLSNSLPFNSGSFVYTSIYKNNGKLIVGAQEYNGINTNICSSINEGQNWAVNSNYIGWINSIFKSNTDLF